jgi:hypothetical protein
MRKLVATVSTTRSTVFSPTKAPSFGSSASLCPRTVSPAIRRSSSFFRARTHTSWAAPPTRPSPSP